MTVNQWSELRGRITAFSPCSLPLTSPSPMTRANVFFRVHFKVSSGARAFLMSYKSTYLGNILRTGRRRCKVSNRGGAANAEVTRGCGYSHRVLGWASCISTAWDYDRAGTERGKTRIHPPALWFSQVFWHPPVFQILKES